VLKLRETNGKKSTIIIGHMLYLNFTDDDLAIFRENLHLTVLIVKPSVLLNISRQVADRYIKVQKVSEKPMASTETAPFPPPHLRFYPLL
jgi:hypothetical protein